MKWNATVIALFVTLVNYSQVKDDISIVQYSAEFLKEKEISLKSFKDYNTQVLYLSKDKKIFEKENIKYLPTVILYNDGNEILRIDGGIKLSLPENTNKQIQEEINLILRNRF
ncbi:MAG: hypothetical protein Unbinned5607contig1000_43 [Prokaryotic dsDNA virus sp.]|nr:MAG: hypothetical protein Unbinned5607contig1000_43 [Prokaryotic dsDNA virus sp.]|tara:strand:+ start:19270 stop:19608 length:339 start_codon:yes stop_codon:yes gene_type:complete